MNATKVTKAMVLALARKKYGARAEIRYNPKALEEAAKAVIREQHHLWLDRIRSIKAERKEIIAAGDPRTTLRKAARFAIDVDGDEPSWTQLREALERVEHYEALGEEMAETEASLRKNTGKLASHRWETTRIINLAGLAMCEIHESADTLEELAAKLS